MSSFTLGADLATDAAKAGMSPMLYLKAMTAMATASLPTSASFNLSDYQQLKGSNVVRENMGRIAHGYLESGRRDTFLMMLQRIKEYDYTPVNGLEKTWISAAITHWISTDGHFDIHYNKVQYIPWNSYVVDLQSEMSTDTYLAKLLLHEAAGLCLDTRPTLRTAYAKSFTDTLPKVDQVTTLPFNLILWDYQGQADKMTAPNTHEANPFNPLTQMSSISEWSIRTGEETKATVEAGFATYLGFNPYLIESWVQLLLGYQQLVYQRIINESFNALSSAKLEDEYSVKNALSYFLRLLPSEIGKIGRSQAITVSFGDGQFTKSYNFKTLPVTIPVVDKKGNTLAISAYEALVWMCEASFIKACWDSTLNKLGSRVNMLADPLATIRDASTTPWNKNPWENPFLTADIAATQSSGSGTYVQAATAQALNPVKTVTDMTVRPEDVIAAPQVVRRYASAAHLPGGAAVFPDSTPAGPQGLITLLAAAAGIGAYVYFQSR